MRTGGGPSATHRAAWYLALVRMHPSLVGFLFCALAFVAGCNSSSTAGSPDGSTTGAPDGSSSGTQDGSSALGPGCLGSPDASCSPYPEGTVCPGPPTVCAPCGAGIYTRTESDCSCTSGNWHCASPTAGEVQCPSPVGQYVDPTCTVLYGTDAGADAAVEAGAGDAGVEPDADGGEDG
jgi:hypothetical protein